MKNRGESHRRPRQGGSLAARPNPLEPGRRSSGSSSSREPGDLSDNGLRPQVPWRSLLLAWILGLVSNLHAATPSPNLASCRAAVVAAFDEVAAHAADSGVVTTVAAKLAQRLELDHPVCWQWILQDNGPDLEPWLAGTALPDMVHRAVEGARLELGEAVAPWLAKAAELTSRLPKARPVEWVDLYLELAESRRQSRLTSLRRQHPEWVFMKHHVLGGSHYAYTEGLSDAQSERQFEPGAALCLLDLRGGDAAVRTLIEDHQGVLRDLDVSWDGKRVLFAWKRSDRDDDYHLHELETATGRVRQLTYGLGFADYEGVYLPDGDLLFNSTRCVQTVDCWWTEVSNLYTCRADGSGLRRLTFDQVHDNYPTILPDGRVVYTRWEYNDRGQIFVQGLFQMNPDGTGQSEFYGNNSWFPTALLHARGIPGTRKVVAIFSGHHTRQTGKLGIVDPGLGRQENSGTQLIAPVRATPAERVDAYGQDGIQFQYPYPLSETEFVVACAPSGWAESPPRFGLYWVAADGRRELLVIDSALSCGQAIPNAARPVPPARPTAVDLTKQTGTCYVQDVHAGPGLAGVPRGAVAKLRVVGLEFRAAGVGCNYNSGPAGDALISTPVALGNGTWDVKSVLGEARVHPDGSVFFTAPARQPFYLQAVDARGYAIQSMRSWMTLQPGENASCTGCHEDKNSTPPVPARTTLAFAAGPQALTPFHGPPRAFS